MNVLIIEEEGKLSGYLVSGLEQEGFTVERARSGLDGLHGEPSCHPAGDEPYA